MVDRRWNRRSRSRRSQCRFGGVSVEQEAVGDGTGWIEWVGRRGRVEYDDENGNSDGTSRSAGLTIESCFDHCTCGKQCSV
jgi:hypothetical protein